MWSNNRKHAIVCTGDIFLRDVSEVLLEFKENGAVIVPVEDFGYIIEESGISVERGRDESVRNYLFTTAFHFSVKKNIETFVLALPTTEYWLLAAVRKSEIGNSKFPLVVVEGLKDPTGEMIISAEGTKKAVLHFIDLLKEWASLVDLELDPSAKDTPRGRSWKINGCNLTAIDWVHFYFLVRKNCLGDKVVEVYFRDIEEWAS